MRSELAAFAVCGVRCAVCVIQQHQIYFTVTVTMNDAREVIEQVVKTSVGTSHRRRLSTLVN